MIRTLAVSTVLAFTGIAHGSMHQDEQAAPVILAEAIVHKHNVPGISIAVIDRGEIVFTQVAGNRMKGYDEAPIGIDDRFHIGSCTKAFTSTLAGMFVEEGLLSWDTTIAEAFPDLAGTMHEAYGPITLEQLLAHRAGVMTFTRPGEAQHEMTKDLEGTPMEQRQVFVSRLLAAEPINTPGKTYEYSNAGYAVVAAMIERAAGASWQSLVRSRIFEPLGMTNSGFGLPARSQNDTSQPWGHFAREGDLFIIPPIPQGVVPTCVESAGDIHCSIQDLARFAQMHLKSLRGEDTLLTAATVANLHQVRGDNYALGWFNTAHWGGEATAHNGSAGLFFSWMVIWPEDNMAIVAMSNAGGPGDVACREFIKWMRDLYLQGDTADGEPAQGEEDESDESAPEMMSAR